MALENSRFISSVELDISDSHELAQRSKVKYDFSKWLKFLYTTPELILYK